MDVFFETWSDYVGLAGGAIISVILFPQIWKAYKTKSTGDLSWTMLGTYFVGLVLFGIYGFANRLWPICFSWVVEMTLLVTQAIMKLVFDRRTAERLRREAIASESRRFLLPGTYYVSCCGDLPCQVPINESIDIMVEEDKPKHQQKSTLRRHQEPEAQRSSPLQMVIDFWQQLMLE